jgi:hypothetical protein
MVEWECFTSDMNWAAQFVGETTLELLTYHESTGHDHGEKEQQPKVRIRRTTYFARTMPSTPFAPMPSATYCFALCDLAQENMPSEWTRQINELIYRKTDRAVKYVGEQLAEQHSYGIQNVAVWLPPRHDVSKELLQSYATAGYTVTIPPTATPSTESPVESIAIGSLEIKDPATCLICSDVLDGSGEATTTLRCEYSMCEECILA